MRKYTWFFLGIFLLLAPDFGAAAQQLKLGVVTKPGAAQNIAAEKFRDILEHESKGRFTVTIYHSASIGDETRILEQLQTGAIHLAIVNTDPFEIFTPIVRVIRYPFLFKNSRQADEILDGPLGREIFKILEPSGFKGLAFSENGFRSLTNNRNPVQTADDLQGMKIRVMSSPPHKAIWQALGASPAQAPWPIYSELADGGLDGQENPLWVVDVYNFFEVQKYMTMTNHIYSAHIDVASMTWWQKQPAATRELIQDAMYRAAVFQRKDNRTKEAERLYLLKEKGMIVEEHPDTESFRAKVSNLKDLDYYATPQVQDLLTKMLEATKE